MSLKVISLFLCLFIFGVSEIYSQNRYNYLYETTGDVLEDGELFLKYDMSKVTGLVYGEGEWAFEFSYKNGRRDGVSKRWKYDKIQDEIYFLNGKRDGRSRSWSSNEQLTFEGYYLKGKENGKFVWYSIWGKKIAEENYISGKKDGECKYYDENGELKFIEYFKNDVFIRTTENP